MRRRPALAGLFGGLAASAKLWPALLAIPLLALCLAGRRMPEFGAASWGESSRWRWSTCGVILWPKKTGPLLRRHHHRSVDWARSGNRRPLPLGNEQYGLPPVQWLIDHPAVLNVVTWILIAVALTGVVMLTARAPRRPRLAQVAFLTLALFLIVGKAWSEQFVLWLIPLAVLARPRWGAFVAWQAAEVAYFARSTAG